jgi:esterase
VELTFKTFGQGAPIIILHGLFGTLDNWQTIAKQLADHHSVYILDQRNHGRSPHSPIMNYHVMVEDLRHFMESHWIHRAYMVGHSMGGKTAMNFALEHPDMVEKLIVVDIAPGRYIGMHHAIFEGLKLLESGDFSDRNDADHKLHDLIPHRTVRQFLLKNLTRNKSGAFELKLNLPVLEKNYQNLLERVVSSHVFEKPTLFIRGSDSTHVLAKDEPDIHALFPNSVVETVRGAGHWVHHDKPQELVKLVREFLG